MKRLISLILTFILLFSLVLTVPSSVSAATTANLNIKVQKYVSGSYTNDATVKSGDVVTLFVTAQNTVNNVAGLTMEISYDNSKLEYKESSFITYVSDKNADASATDMGEKMLIMFDTTSKQTAFSGNIFSLTFTVVSGAAVGEAVFSASVKEMFDSSSKAEDILFANIGDVSVNVVAVAIPSETLAAFEAVVNVVYKPDTAEDSADDIVAAVQALAALDNAQVALLKSEHPELFEAVNTAQYRYSLLQQNAAVESVNKEVDSFLSKYSDVFKMNPDKITLKNKERIESAATYMDKALSSAAKSRVPSDKKSLLKKLSQKIEELLEYEEELKEAKEAVEEFKNTYKLLFTVDDATLKSNYSDLFLMLEEAELVYGMMSDAAKSLLTAERKAMDAIKVKLDEALAADEAAKAASEKASEFMRKWKYVFALNDFNVTAGDESIVKVFISEYESLEADVKEALKSRVARIYSLVDVIASLKNASGEGQTTNPETQTQIVTQTETQIVTQTLPQTITQTVTETVTETLTKNVEKGVGRLIFWLVIILGALILTTALPIATLLYKKKEKAGGIENEE